MTYLIQNGLLVQEEQVQQSDILIEGEQVREISPVISAAGLPREARVIDAAGCFVLPGLIDAHTHYHLVSRGAVTADGFAEGSRAAAYGGVTTVIDFADHKKGLSLLQCSLERAEAMAEAMAVDFALHQGVYHVHEGIPGELKGMREAGIAAVKIFTTYKQAGYLIDTGRLRELFAACRSEQVLITVHAEDDLMIEDISEAYAQRVCPPSMHPILRPAEAEAQAIGAITSLAGTAGIPIYIVHVSSGLGLEAVRRARERGDIVAAETTPHYLLLDQECLDLPDAQLYVMTPPLRTRQDNQVLWDGIENGEISVIATDHCAFTREQKLQHQDCRTILPGIPGTEELLSLIYTHGVKSGRTDIQGLARLLSANPARHFGLYPRKGTVSVGSDADLVLFDPAASWTITNESQHTAAGYTPYDGMEVFGKVRLTMRRGEILVDQGEYRGTPGTGKFQASGVSDLFPG